jgi:AbrB family looped-hinge helix DNA binding protein
MATHRNTRLVRLHPRGQVTIPVEFRKRLGIDENTILQIRLRGSGLDITPLRVEEEHRLIREYDRAEIRAFLREDRLDAKTANRVRKLLGG